MIWHRHVDGMNIVLVPTRTARQTWMMTTYEGFTNGDAPQSPSPRICASRHDGTKAIVTDPGGILT